MASRLSLFLWDTVPNEELLKAAAEERIPMPATEAAFRVNSAELAQNDEEDFSAVLRRMEEVAGIAAIHSEPVTS